MDKIYAMHRCKKAEKVENPVCWTTEACHAEALCPPPLADVGSSPVSLGIERHTCNQCVEVSVIGFMVFQ